MLHRASAGLIVFVLVFALGGCSGTETPTDFQGNRKLVLEAVADRLIVPGYTLLEQRADTLAQAVTAFSATPDQVHLNAARIAWTNALLAWERVTSYDFGPAETTFGSLNTDIATFPTSVDKIEAAIAAGDTSTQDFDRDKRGFFALDYLLFADNSQPLTNADSVKRRAYMVAVAEHLHGNVAVVKTAWTSYRAEFIERNGTDAGSSMSLLFNAMNISYEQAKNFKVALPAGRRVGQTVPAPNAVEAYYSGVSIRALKAHMNTVIELWEGNEPTIKSFKFYLSPLPGGERLIQDTRTQMDSLQLALDAFSENERLSDLIVANDPRIDDLVEHTQKMSRFLKSELSSILGIAITYSSGDGD